MKRAAVIGLEGQDLFEHEGKLWMLTEAGQEKLFTGRMGAPYLRASLFAEAIHTFRPMCADLDPDCETCDDTNADAIPVNMRFGEVHGFRLREGGRIAAFMLASESIRVKLKTRFVGDEYIARGEPRGEGGQRGDPVVRVFVTRDMVRLALSGVKPDADADPDPDPDPDPKSDVDPDARPRANSPEDPFVKAGLQVGDSRFSHFRDKTMRELRKFVERDDLMPVTMAAREAVEQFEFLAPILDSAMRPSARLVERYERESYRREMLSGTLRDLLAEIAYHDGTEDLPFSVRDKAGRLRAAFNNWNNLPNEGTSNGEEG